MNSAQKPRWIHSICDPLPDDIADPVSLLGGKGSGLQAMCQAGLPVPPGFVISTECCNQFFSRNNRWPEGLQQELRSNLERLERDTGMQYGAGSEPLLVSVRSGAARSMPGMMDTLLNVGLHPALAEEIDEKEHFWELYTDFIIMFATTAGDIDAKHFLPIREDLQQGASRELAQRAIDIYEDHVESAFPTDPWQLLCECIDTVFKSWNNERALEYRRRNDIRGLSGTAVTVQVMFPSKVSGILFTQDPNTFEATHMIIEASWGLGEAIVSGNVSPDRYTVDRENPDEYEVVIGDKRECVRAMGDCSQHDPHAPCLSKEEIRRLWELGIKTEEYFKSPRDLEWAIKDGELVLLQSRAIRGLEIVQDAEVGRQEEIARLYGMISEGERRVWVTHNLAETLAYPTPMTWDIISEFMSGDGGFGRMYCDLGYLPSEQVKKKGFLELICGRIYADPIRLADLFWDGMPMRYDVDLVAEQPDRLNQAPDQFDPDHVEPDFPIKLPRILLGMIKNTRRLRRQRKKAAEDFESVALPPYLDYIQSMRGLDLTDMPTEQLIDELDQRCERVLGEFGKESLKPGFAAGLALQQMQQILTELTDPDESQKIANNLTMALEGDLSVEQDLLLNRVAAGKATMEEFLEKYGHRGVGEMELMEPRWREDTAYIHNLVEQIKRGPKLDPESRHDKNLLKRKETQKNLPVNLREWGGSALLEDLTAFLTQAQNLLPYRENGKYYLMMGYEYIRLVLVELGRRWDIGNDVFFLRKDELRRFEKERESLESNARDRNTRWKAFKRLDMPDVVDSADLSELGLPRHVGVDEWSHRLRGEGVAAGVARGTARIVFDPRESGQLGDEYVLVCPSTDPGWTSLFVRAQALVVERGGSLSHGAIVARDLGIPAVVCPDATRRISDGASIRVDGNNGIITLMED